MASRPGRSGVTMTVDRLASVLEGIHLMTDTKVMVGVPSDKPRKEGPINNAALAFIHDKGAPEANIPPRPFMEPGVKRVKDEVAEGLKKAGQFALDGRPEAVTRQFHRVGMIARDSIKLIISEGIPPPLALSTVMRRINRRNSAKYRIDKKAQVAQNIDQGAAPGEGLFTPLIDTGALRNAINYVLRKGSK